MSSKKKYRAPASLLQDAGLRPTQQRLALAGWLFDGTHKHVTAEQVYAAARKRRISISLATVYNTLNSFRAAGLLGQVVVDTDHVYFDTNRDVHHHLLDEESGKLTDIAPVRVAQIPKLGRRQQLIGVDIVVRIKTV